MKKCFITCSLLLSLLFSSFTFAHVNGSLNDNKNGIATSSNAGVDYYFTRAGQHPDKALIGLIDSTKKDLDIAIYSITDKDIVNSIINAKNRGVSVKIITDKQESKNKYQKAELALMAAANIPIKINKHFGIMHLKCVISDLSTVSTGSFNYSLAASTVNDEVLVLLHSSKISEDFDAEFQAMWDNQNDYISY